MMFLTFIHDEQFYLHIAKENKREMETLFFSSSGASNKKMEKFTHNTVEALCDENCRENVIEFFILSTSLLLYICIYEFAFICELFVE